MCPEYWHEAADLPPNHKAQSPLCGTPSELPRPFIDRDLRNKSICITSMHCVVISMYFRKELGHQDVPRLRLLVGQVSGFVRMLRTHHTKGVNGTVAATKKNIA